MAFLGPLLTSQQKDDLAAYLGSGNPAAGRILYRSITGTAISCAAAECHGATPGADTLGLSNGSNNPQRILDSIDANPAKQALRNFLSTQDVKDIAAYLAGDPVHGRVLYQNIPGAPRTCSASTCHGPDPSLNRRGFLVAANNPAAIFHQIEVNPRMRFLGNFLSTQDIKDVSAYLANLSVAASAGLPTQLDFGFQMVATTGPVHALPFTNVSGVQLNIASVTASGDFTLSHDCASILEPGQTCMLSLNFAPTASGSRQGQLIINDDAVGSPHAVALSGNGAAFPTNSGGGGCNISHSLPVDPTLPLGLVLAVAVLNYRRRRL